MNRKRFMSAGVFHKIPRMIDSRLLTSARGRKYYSNVIRRGDSALGAAIQHAAEKINAFNRGRDL